MSMDSLPDCVAECLQDQADSLGCDKDDVQCFCEKEVSGSDGPELSSCVLGACPAEDMLSIGTDMLTFCDQFTGGSSESSRSSDSATLSTTLSTAERTSDATSTVISATEESDSGPNEPSSQPESAQDSGSVGLSTGAKAGIGVGAVIGVVLLLVGAFILGRRRRRVSEPSSSSNTTEGRKWGPELEGEKWVPELEGQKNQRPVELEADSTMTQQPSIYVDTRPQYIAAEKE